MAVAHESSTESHTGSTGSTSEASFDISVPFTSSSRGLLVSVFELGTNNGDVQSVKIDPSGANTDVPAVSGGMAQDTSQELGRCTTFFLGSGLPTTTTTVRVNRTNNTDVLYAVAETQTASGATAVHTAGIVLLQENGSLAEQNVDDGSPGTNSLRYAALYSGQASVPSAGSNSTAGPGIALAAGRNASTVRETTAGQGSRPVGFSSGTSDDRAGVHLAIKETAATQSLTGTLFTKAPTFPTGVVTPGAVTLAGSLFTKAPTFPTGVVSSTGGAQTLDGALFQKAPTFPQGAVTSSYSLTGNLFQKAPTFPSGALQYYTNLLVVELDDEDPPSVDTDHFLRINTRATAGAGMVRERLYQGATLIAGHEFTPTGSFVTYEYELLEAEAAAITDYDDLQIHVDVKGTTLPFTVEVDWVELERPPAFQTLSGVLFQKAPTFPTGQINLHLAGTLFQKAPTFPTGAVTLGSGPQTLDGSLFQKAPSFPQGIVSALYPLAGVTFNKAPTFPTGAITATYALTGSTFQKAPTFPQGAIGIAGEVSGVLFVKAPTFPTGAVTQSGGSFWQPNPAAYTPNPAAYDPVLPGEVPPWPIEVTGTLFAKQPSFFVGAVT